MTESRHRYYFNDFKVLPTDAPLLDTMRAFHREVLTTNEDTFQLAVRVGVKSGTIKSRRHRARKILVVLRKAAEPKVEQPAP